MNPELTALLQELKAFPRREEGLRAIYRWSGRSHMLYRPNLFSHSKKVAWLVISVLPTIERVLGKDFDGKKCMALGLVHDDAELITGDYQAGAKAIMSAEQLAAIDAEERDAIETLSKRFPPALGGYVYKDLLFDILDLHSPEAQVAKYLDLIDGFGEGIHEIYAGNVSFTKTAPSQFGETPRFDELNVRRRDAMMRRYPALQALCGSHILFEPSVLPDWTDAVTNGAPHTHESFLRPAGYPQYDTWKQAISDAGDSEELKKLYTQVA